MRFPKSATLAMLSALLICSPVYADEEQFNDKGVGLIGVRELHPPEKEIEDPDVLGFIRVPGDIVQPKPGTPTEEGDKISAMLQKATNPTKLHDYAAALNIIETVRASHPEIPMLWSWRAIYLDLLGQYEESLNAWDERERLFPFEEPGLEREYYRADALFNTGKHELGRKMVDDALEKIKTGDTQIFSRKEMGAAAKNAFTFLKIKMQDERTAEEIEALWDAIPRDERDGLGNYYGFNLAELWYWYGSAFDRPQHIKKFIDTERRSENEQTIKVLQAALREEYR